nr:putative lipid II flippase FtsW [Motilibacter deserti]
MLARPSASYVIVLASAGLLMLLGLVMVLSASSVDSYLRTRSSFTEFRKQAMFFAIGVPVLVVASRLPVRVWRVLAYPALLVAGVMLALVPFMGHEVNGNTNWLVIGGIQVQPSEAAKLALVLWGADLLARKERLLDQWKHLLAPLLPVGAAFLLFVLLGQDLGTALVLMAIVLALLFFAGAPFRVFAMVMAAGSAGAVWLAVTHPTRVERIISWTQPSTDPMSTNFQATHGKFALGTGGWTGVGLGGSREKWPGLLPEAQNDFIFAIIGEELGLIGTLLVLALFGALCYGGLRVAMRTQDSFVRLAAAGVTIWIAFQTLVNIGAVLGVVPVIGIPLPLVSAGGSALLTTMAAIGLLLALARDEARRGRRLPAGAPRPRAAGMSGRPDSPTGRPAAAGGRARGTGASGSAPPGGAAPGEPEPRRRPSPRPAAPVRSTGRPAPASRPQPARRPPEPRPAPSPRTAGGR